ncbi:MAG: hypothetical protein ACLPT4_01955 [Verrucomicrobiia bacterium]
MDGTHEKVLRDAFACALNEQGFLFQQRVRETIAASYATGKDDSHRWGREVIEYPVTAADNRQTRIDMVLTNHQGVYLCLECKRARPEYKAWAFFDKSPSANSRGHDELFVELIARRPEQAEKFKQVEQRIGTIKDPACACFNSYLEMKIDRNGRVSSTETIEDALSQVMFGQTGLMRKLLSFEKDFFFAVVPVVVTTAQLYEAEFEIESVALDTGTLASSDLELKPLDYLVVNYHASDSLALDTKVVYTPYPRSDIASDLLRWQMRSVFVVRAESINTFLKWAGKALAFGRINP